MLHLGTRALIAISIFALVISAFVIPQPTAADTIDRSTRFGSEDQTFEEFTPQVAPTGADLSTLVRVVVKLTAKPVALVKAANPGKQIDQAQRDNVKAALRSDQAALRPQIEALGGRILGQYQSAINGFKVEIARRDLARLATLSGVSGIDPVAIMTADNSTSVPYIGAPQVWSGLTGFRGERIKVGIIDTGIDYTHANFAGPGTTAAFDAAFSTNTAPANPAYFGPNAPKVKGGIDLVGDSYDANDPHSVPVPDPNPLDCNGHGSHVAGTVAGFGVTGSGATYTGTYDSSTPFSTMTIGPGVAPKADLYAIRVFGCAGSTDVTVDAIDWAVDHDMDVINMSLGSSFGASDDASAEASDNAAKAGVVVVASAGNSGSAPYITGSPATATRALSVAANDATSSFPGVALTGTPNVTGINANGATFANGLSLPVKVLMNGTNIALGCNQSDYAGTAGMIVVVQRGTCARVARAIYGQKAGAKAVLMVNTSDAYPPYEGKITSNPDTGEAYTVTIPFIGTKSSTGPALKAATGSLTLNNTLIANPTYTAIADFSSGGPRMRDSNIKPDVAAPGVSTLSTAIGSGNQGERLSGTSMAAPHATGVAALVLQSMGKASRDDDEDGNGIAERVKAAITNTASSGAIAGFKMQTAGAGLVQPVPATRTRVVATGDSGTGSLSFGYAETRTPYSATKKIGLQGLAKGDTNNQNGHAFTVSSTAKNGPAHTITLSTSSVSLDEGEHRSLTVTLKVNPANSKTADLFQDVAGTIDFTPVGGTNNGVTLHVPYYMVFRGSSNLDGSLSRAFNAAHPDANVNLTNAAGAITAGADFYTLGITSPNDGHGQTDLRAAGVQIFQSSGLMVFAVNTYARYSNAAVNEVDIYVDVDRDGHDDYIVFGADNGLIRTGSRSGVFATFVYNIRRGTVSPTGDTAIVTDNSTVLLYAFRSQLRQAPSATWPAAASWSLTAGNPRFSYSVDVFAGRDGTDDIGSGGSAKVNAYNPSLPTGQFATVAVNGTSSVPVHINAAEWANTPALGVMVVGLDNAAGAPEAKLIYVTP